MNIYWPMWAFDGVLSSLFLFYSVHNSTCLTGNGRHERRLKVEWSNSQLERGGSQRLTTGDQHHRCHGIAQGLSAISGRHLPEHMPMDRHTLYWGNVSLSLKEATGWGEKSDGFIYPRRPSPLHTDKCNDVNGREQKLNQVLESISCLFLPGAQICVRSRRLFYSL